MHDGQEASLKGSLKGAADRPFASANPHMRAFKPLQESRPGFAPRLAKFLVRKVNFRSFPARCA